MQPHDGISFADDDPRLRATWRRSDPDGHVRVPQPREARHVLRTEPARVAVELMLPERVARDEMNAVTFRQEAQRHLTRREAAADHDDGLA